jgi:hypothetical protein
MSIQTVSFRIEASKVANLDTLASAQQKDRTSVLIEAVDAYLAAHQDRSAVPVKGFGIWKDKPVDGLAYQKRMRAEWNRR